MTDPEKPPEGFSTTAPKIEAVTVSKCPVCGSADSRHVATGFDYEIETCSNAWHFLKCDRCGTVRLDPRPKPSELSKIYPSTYYAYDLTGKISPIAAWGKQLLDFFKFRSILKSLCSEPSSYLDIGFGDGRYLRHFKRTGLAPENIYGLELSAELIEKVRKEGYKVFNDRVETTTAISSNSLDLITMFHVIEHVENPSAVVKRLHDWLRPGGVVALETPNISSADARIFSSGWWGGYHIPRHWTLFNEHSLKKLMMENGFEVVALKYQTGHSFWMYSFHHILKYGPHWRLPRFAKYFDPMKGLLPLIFFTAFDVVRRTLGFSTSAMMIIARKAQ